ncbi:hypothetical protein LUZ60_009537 [Juncus effusus]|nr:hypothetical protein LUZ60_009537 [Juncus effusus]
MVGLSTKIRVYFLFFSLCYLSILVSHIGALEFNYNFSDGNYANIKREGDTSFTPEAISLTRDQANQSTVNSIGRISYNQSVLIWDNATRELTNFVTHFSFIISTKASNEAWGKYGDGIAFFLSKYPSKLPPFYGGGYLGLVPNETYSIKNHIVAVEIDTFSNVWDPQLDATEYDHIGININTVKSTEYTVVPKIESGRVMNASIYYNGTTKLLTAFIYNDELMSNFGVNATIDLTSILPEVVAVGLSAGTGGASELHQILSWSFNSTLERKFNSIPEKFNSSSESNSNSTPEKKPISLQIIVGSIIGICSMTTLVAFVWFLVWRKRSINDNREMEIVFEEGRGPRRFSYSKLAAATNNFAVERKLGQGGFGSVYQGFLSDLGLHAAIKKVPKETREGKKSYISEVNIISRLRHRNLVQLIGWCHERGDFLLVYELMPQGSLDAHLYNSERILTWAIRQKIALGLSSALLYLHNEWEQCVLHRDIKPSNLMLDSAFNAKLGDFGLARLIDHNCSQATLPGGTFGYLAPECVTLVRASKESDVFSFGVVLLEIACGRTPVIQADNPDKNNLVNWVWNLYGRNAIFEAADERLNDEYDKREMECMMIVGLWCAHPDYTLRASIKEAVSVLNFESPLPILPSKMPVPVYALPVDANAHFGEPSSVASSSTRRTTESGIYSISSTNPSSSYSSSTLPKQDE